MFRPSSRSSSPFSLMDLDMWDAKSRFSAQVSAWCGMAAVSGSEFLSRFNTSTSDMAGGFRNNDPGLRKWQSLSHLAPEDPMRSFSPSPGAEFRAARGASRQSEVGQWLQDVHDRLDTHLDRLMSSNAQMSYRKTAAQLHDMKHKLSEALGSLELEKETAELSLIEKSRQRAELHKKVLQLEKELLQMKSLEALERGSSDQATERSPGTLPLSQGDVSRPERHKVDREVCDLREALREAEMRAKTQEEERDQALQKLQASAETQRALLNQIEEMNQRLNHTRQNHTEVQEQLSEANNRISQACLEKAILSTQVLKLEDDIKDLRLKHVGPQSDRGHLIQENSSEHQINQLQRSEASKQDHETALMKEESKALRELNNELQRELEVVRQKLETSQSQLEEHTAEQVVTSAQITELRAQHTQLVREKEMCKLNESQQQELAEMREKSCKLRESMEASESEKLKLQERCLCLEAMVLEKEEKLQEQEEEYRKKEAARVRSNEEQQAVVRHWREKWQKAALSLQTTQRELEELKQTSRKELQAQTEGQKDQEETESVLQCKTNTEAVTTAKKESESLLKDEPDACTQELELQRSRNPMLRQKGVEASMQTQDEDKDLSQSLSDARNQLHNKPPQSSEVQTLKQKLAETEQELREKAAALRSLEKQRELELKEARLKISVLELKAGGDGATSGLKANMEGSQKEENQEKTQDVQKLPALRQHSQAKDGTASAESRKDKSVGGVNLEMEMEQQRRKVAEQLKNLFKEREGKQEGQSDLGSAQPGATSLQDQSSTPKLIRSSGDRRSWHQCSGLMPVFEEDEEEEEEEGKQAEEASTAEDVHSKNLQMSALNTESSRAKTKAENLLPDVATLEEPVQGLLTGASEQPASAKELRLPLCSGELHLQQRRMPPTLYPDGIFQAELIEICSPDEDDEERENR